MRKFILLSNLCLLFHSLQAQCPITSVLGGHIIYNDLSQSPVVWSNLPGAENSDDNRTASTVLVSTNNTIITSDLWAQTFLLSVPSNAIICGVEVRIERRQQGAITGTSTITDKSIKLISNMTVVGTNHAQASAWSNTDQVQIYGGSGDLWGLSLTPADVNAPDFGVAISAQLQNTGSTSTLSAQIDKVSLAVYYTFPLPVELLNFNATANNRQVDLSWTTASESNNSYFTLQRSTDAIHWTNIANITASGTTNSENHYSYMDLNAPEGTVYYNLEQTDFDGTTNHLGTATINVQVSNEINLHFNPALSALTIQGIPTGKTFSMNILDLSGKTVFANTYTSSENNLIITDPLMPGLYFFQVEVEEQSAVKKVMF